MTKDNLQSLAIIFLCFMLMSLNCHKNKLPYTESGNWINRADFEGLAVGEAATFVIGEFAYVGTGIDFSHPNSRISAMYQFDPSGNGGWQEIANFPGSPRSSAVGFSVLMKGYIATGFDGERPLNDCWEYDPQTNKWQQKSSIGNSSADFARYDAIGFGIGDLGYITTGNTGSGWLEDLWQYDPASDTWTERRGSGKKRSSSICFVYNGKAYIFCGTNNGKLLNDGWLYDPSLPDSSAWQSLNHITNFTNQSFDDSYSDIVRSNGVAFIVKDKGYLTTGNAGSLNASTWEYDFGNDLWQPKTPFYGSAREGAVGFTVQNRGFVTTGFSGTSAYDDTWEFRPDEVQNKNQ
ncbi:MAG: galactose oxidase [Bacteroidetes bacterium]|nr:MAG: galactose oxidase [Bacteroidota bacterium]